MNVAGEGQLGDVGIQDVYYMVSAEVRVVEILLMSFSHTKEKGLYRLNHKLCSVWTEESVKSNVLHLER